MPDKRDERKMISNVAIREYKNFEAVKCLSVAKYVYYLLLYLIYSIQFSALS